MDNDGITGQLPGDAWGFGVYHGQYAFALLSKYEILTEKRTFQNFKWKDMEGSEIPKITICDGSKPIPDGMSCGRLIQYFDSTLKIFSFLLSSLSTKNFQNFFHLVLF